MNRAFRRLNSNIARVLFIPLIITAITGIVLGLGERFGILSIPISNILTAIHQGGFLGTKLVPFYVLLMGLGVFVIGLTTLIKSRDSLISQGARPNTFSAYKLLALILVFPLAVCVETGVAYQLGTDWLKMPPQQTNIFLSMHTGASLGAVLGIFYTLVTGLSLIAFSLEGIKTTSFRKTMSSSPSQFRSPAIEAKQPSQQTLPPENNVALLKKKIRNAIIIFSVIFIAILCFATSAILMSIAIVAIVFTAPAWIIAGRLLKDWQQQQQEIKTQLYDEESESATILRAIPDSMLRMTQDGTCISYIPAKDASPFIIQGEVIDRHVTEFLAPEIALQFIKSARLSSETGLTHFYHFPIPLDNGEKRYHEARISAIGATEVLILIRELANYERAEIETAEQPIDTLHQDDSVSLLSEAELVQILELALEKIQQQPEQHHILCCLVIDDLEIEIDRDALIAPEKIYSDISDALMYQVAAKMQSYLSSDYIAAIGNNELLSLILDCSLERASASVAELRQGLNDFLFRWQEREYPINVSVSLLEIDAKSPSSAKLIDVAKATCNMAKQKVEVKNFW